MASCGGSALHSVKWAASTIIISESIHVASAYKPTKTEQGTACMFLNGHILQVRQQCPGGLQLQLVEENNNDKVHSAANVHSNPKEQRDEVEQQG